MEVHISDDKLVIELPIEESPAPSSTGKTLLLASTGGFRQTDAEYGGQRISVSVNATIKNRGGR